MQPNRDKYSYPFTSFTHLLGLLCLSAPQPGEGRIPPPWQDSFEKVPSPTKLSAKRGLFTAGGTSNSQNSKLDFQAAGQTAQVEEN